MPWRTVKQGNSYNVVKKDGSGKVVGRHPTKAKADAHVNALYANVKPKSGKKSY